MINKENDNYLSFFYDSICATIGILTKEGSPQVTPQCIEVKSLHQSIEISNYDVELLVKIPHSSKWQYDQ
ncbi:hypothetical protein [Flavobacterium sp. N502536]|uniref:hypothetical protein n=1 Tax=Flavobacterium sp. N502536 TaxID=2986837 RepID=UPI002222DE68|nr:hypothetical protein [Flavobacterium sp. N502536]